MNKVYVFEYCGCIHESSYAAISIHKTIEGANESMRRHKELSKKQYDALYEDDEAPIAFGEFESWRVVEVDVFN